MPTTRMWRGIELQVTDPGSRFEEGMVRRVGIPELHAYHPIEVGIWPNGCGGNVRLFKRVIAQVMFPHPVSVDEVLDGLGEQLDAIRDLFWPPSVKRGRNARGGWVMSRFTEIEKIHIRTLRALEAEAIHKAERARLELRTARIVVRRGVGPASTLVTTAIGDSVLAAASCDGSAVAVLERAIGRVVANCQRLFPSDRDLEAPLVNEANAPRSDSPGGAGDEMGGSVRPGRNLTDGEQQVKFGSDQPVREVGCVLHACHASGRRRQHIRAPT